MCNLKPFLRKKVFNGPLRSQMNKKKRKYNFIVDYALLLAIATAAALFSTLLFDIFDLIYFNSFSLKTSN